MNRLRKEEREQRGVRGNPERKRERWKKTQREMLKVTQGEMKGNQGKRHGGEVNGGSEGRE